MDSVGSADLRFRSPQPDISLYYETMNTRLVYLFTSQPKLVLILLTPEGWKAELTKLAGYIPRWFAHLRTVTDPSTN